MATKKVTTTANGIQVHCKYDKLVKLADLIPNPDNPNQHPDEQIELLAKIIRSNGWRDRIVVSNLSGMIVKGHGRYQAAQLAELKAVPVEYQDYESRADELRDLIADNKIAELSLIDNDAARALIESLDDYNFDDIILSDFGFTDDEISECFSDGSDGNYKDDKYTRNIEAPIYTPKGKKPATEDLFDNKKTIELTAAIKVAAIPEDIKGFLIAAARRHTVFHYGRIAEFYAHSKKDVQMLMENSGLVIIDFNRAIELGYVRLSESIANQYGIDFKNEQ